MYNYSETKEGIIKDYFRENGEAKARKIITKINNSKHTGSFMYQSRSRRMTPTANDLGSTVLSNVSLSFARPSTVKFACLILLDKWNNEINNDLYLASEERLISIIRSVYQNIH
ncbi:MULTISPECIES: hypothetical protein [Psychroflexus]|jgi:hypothetical protein|uniref:Uncharacterized protein n=2 Tax=Psychroflexus TaxID=83612 RepID=K4IF25_PSYTT|nr:MULTISPECIES: hypothetical protein [Psychroflexus]AFU69147.1 hypothetical protein P700755_002370 [Psychroflexus torquis ATCC 700755]MBZ9620836.1 hypothetical protein [Psychroflexus lacisalsi]